MLVDFTRPYFILPMLESYNIFFFRFMAVLSNLIYHHLKKKLTIMRKKRIFLLLVFSLHPKMLTPLPLLPKMTNMDWATKAWTLQLLCLVEGTGWLLILCQAEWEWERRASLERYNLNYCFTNLFIYFLIHSFLYQGINANMWTKIKGPGGKRAQLTFFDQSLFFIV